MSLTIMADDALAAIDEAIERLGKLDVSF
jgi:hypothetical protein